MSARPSIAGSFGQGDSFAVTLAASVAINEICGNVARHGQERQCRHAIRGV